MASLVLGAVGAAVGFFVGGPTGAQIGWMLGSAIGQSMEPGTTNQGPKLADLRVQSSTYGTHLPTIWGTVRTAGKIIWSTNLQDNEVREKQGGKGGPKVTNVSHTYSASFAIAICKGEVNAIRRIWADEKLIYDVSEGNDGFIGKIQYRMRFYAGTRTQPIDPLIESLKPQGKASAYRGTCYVVFDDLDLTEFGNRIPNFEFEMVRSSASSTTKKLDYFPFSPPNNNNANNHIYSMNYNHVNKFVYGARVIGSFQTVIDKIDPYTKEVVTSAVIPFAPSSIASSDIYINIGIDGNLYILGSISGGPNVSSLCQIDKDTLNYTIKSAGNVPNVVAWRTSAKIVYCDDGLGITAGESDVFNGNGARQANIFKFNPDMNAMFCESHFTSYRDNSLQGGIFGFDKTTETLFFTSYLDSTKKSAGISVIDNTGIREREFILPNPNNDSMNVTDMYFDDVGRHLYLNVFINNTESPAKVYKLNVDTWEFTTGTYGGVDNGLGFPRQLFNVDKNNRRFITNLTQSNTGYYKLCSFDWTTMSSSLIPYSINETDGIYANASFAYCAFIPELNCEYWYGQRSIPTIDGLINNLNAEIAVLTANNTNNENAVVIAQKQARVTYLTSLRNSTTEQYIFVNYGKRVGDGGYDLAEIVKEICLPTGIKEIDFDVSDLVGINVRGYASTSRCPARALIEQLATIYFFDGVGSGSKLYFRLRGRNSVATIDIKELSAQVYSTSVNHGKDLSITRMQELELPRIANLVYLDYDKNQLQNTQQTVRIVKNSQHALTYQIPVVLTADEAKQVIDRLTYGVWAARIKFSFDTNNDYSHLEVGDVITIVKPNVSYLVRLTKKSDSGDGIIRWEGESEDSSIYIQKGTGSTGKLPNQTIDSFSATKLQLLDLPIFSENENDGGFYAIANRYSKNQKWSGAVLFESTDNKDFNSSVSIYAENVIGTATNILGNYSKDNTLDIFNTILVSTNGTLNSISNEELWNGKNIAIIGNEVIQFKNAVLKDTNKYELSGLLRGRFGTESEIELHVANESFILPNFYSNSIKRVHRDVSNINTDIYYKGVTLGTLVDDTTSIKFKNTAKGLKPYAVSNIGGFRSTNGDLNLFWKKRVRAVGLLKDYIDVYDLDADSYDIDIIKNGAVIRTLTTTSTSCFYTTQMQVTDFGSNQSNITAKIYKKNAVIGRGYEAVIAI